MNDTSNKPRTVIDKTEIEVMYDIPSMHVDKVYMSIGGNVCRLCFVEVVQDTEIAKPRVAVSMTIERALGLYDVLGNLVTMVKEAQKKAQEPKEKMQ